MRDKRPDCRVQFKTVVPITDEDIVARIHQNFRGNYIKDVILLRVLDDPSANTLVRSCRLRVSVYLRIFCRWNSVIFFNNMAIMTKLQEDTHFLEELFNKMERLAPLSDLQPPAPNVGATVSPLATDQSGKFVL